MRSVWICGNGIFLRRESSFDEIVWNTETGLTSKWKVIVTTAMHYAQDMRTVHNAGLFEGACNVERRKVRQHRRRTLPKGE